MPNWSPLRRACLAGALVSLVLVFLAGPALATPLDSWRSMDVIVHEDRTGARLLLVSGVLKDDVSLPADVALPIPADAKIQWAGEIMNGSGSSQDPTVKYTLGKTDGYDVLEARLTKSREVQAEIVLPAAVTSDGVRAAEVDWVSPIALESLRVGIRTAGFAKPVEAAPPGVTVEQTADGWTGFTRTDADVRAGHRARFDLEYALVPQPQTQPQAEQVALAQAGGAVAPTSQKSGSPTASYAILAFFVAVVGFVAYRLLPALQ